MKEIWKEIQGYEGIYEISNYGNVKSKARYTIQNHYLSEKILQIHDNGKKYLYVDLYNDGKRQKYYIHRLVATEFIDNPNNYPDINHKDENRYNNYVENLEWCTAKYNNNYGNHAIKASLAHKGKNAGKDNINSKSVICLTTGKVFDTVKEASIYYSIPNLRSAISQWCNGNRKFNYLGKLPDGTKLVWRYYEDYINNI